MFYYLEFKVSMASHFPKYHRVDPLLNNGVKKEGAP